MSPFFIKAIQLLLSLSILIILHELGHFIPAKLFKTRVEKFYLFFDVKFSLLKKKIGETEYGIGWLPLGGYVKISGMIDESMDKEQMAGPPQPWEFRSKPAWQRLIIMLGGVTVNFVLAILIYVCLSYAYGDQYVKADSLKDGVHVNLPEVGKKLGVKTGDKIIAVDGVPVENFNTLTIDIATGETFTIEREGRTIEQKISSEFVAKLLKNKKKMRLFSVRSPFIIHEVPKNSHNFSADFQKGDEIIAVNGQPVTYYDEVVSLLDQNKDKNALFTVKRKDGNKKTVEAKVNEDNKIGVVLSALPFKDLEERGLLKVETIKYSFLESIPAGIDKGWTTLTGYLKQMKMLFNTETEAYKSVGGFGAIGSIFPETWNWAAFWSSTAFISIILAFMNILPIPALDGGHVMFLLYEIITGRKPNDKFMEYAQLFGFVLLMILLLLANGNDIYKMIFD